MGDELRSIFIGLSGLYLVAIIALVLTYKSRNKRYDDKKKERIISIFLIGIAIQCFHFIEEFLTGFHIRLPQLLGYVAWSDHFFVSFNLSWIAIWAVSAIGIRYNYRPAFFALWFFTIAMVLNLIAHPLLALAAKGYFPGLITSPIVGFIGIKLLSELNSPENV